MKYTNNNNSIALIATIFLILSIFVHILLTTYGKSYSPQKRLKEESDKTSIQLATLNEKINNFSDLLKNMDGTVENYKKKITEIDTIKKQLIESSKKIFIYKKVELLKEKLSTAKKIYNSMVKKLEDIHNEIIKTANIEISIMKKLDQPSDKYEPLSKICSKKLDFKYLN